MHYIAAPVLDKNIAQNKENFRSPKHMDDLLNKNALTLLIKYIKRNIGIDFIFGSVKKHWGVLYGYKKWKVRFSWGFYSSHSTGFFIKKSAAEKVGKYNIKYKNHADWDYFYRMIIKNKMTRKHHLYGDDENEGLIPLLSKKKLSSSLVIGFTRLSKYCNPPV